MIHQIKIIQAATLPEIEKAINDWYVQAHDEGLEVDYLGEIKQLPDGTLYAVIDYTEVADLEEAEHHE